MSDDDRRRWDERYRTDGPAADEGVALPTVFQPFADHFPATGAALDVACGRGAAAVWLAQRGLTVRACDISPVAITWARELAERHGCAQRCRFTVTDLDHGLPPGDPVDVLLCNKFRDSRLDDAMIGRLAEGGLLAISVLSEVGATAGPHRAGPGELRHAFAALRVVESGEADGQAWLLARR